MSIRCLSFLCCGFLVTSLSFARAAPGPSKGPPPKGKSAQTQKNVEVVEVRADTNRRLALIIGVEQYQAHANLPPLEYSEDDARAVARALIESGTFARSDVVLMTSDSPNPALVPTRINVLAQLQRLKRERGLDLLFIYYSGHGTALGSGRTRENYLLPADFNPALYGQSAIEVDEVVASAEATQARNRVLVFDACRTAGGKGDAKGNTAFDRPTFKTSKGTHLLYSSEFGSPSYESREKHHGAFTAYLLEALEGEADGYKGTGPMDGVISLDEAYSFVFDQLATPTKAHPVQTPYLGGESAGADVALVTVRPEVKYPHCPADAVALDKVLGRALRACDEPDDVQTVLAQEAYSALSCLDGRLSPELAAKWLFVDATQQTNTMSYGAAAEASRAAKKVLQASGLPDPRPEQCRSTSKLPSKDTGKRASQRATVVVNDPRPGTRMYVNGGHPKDPVQPVPFVLQARWGDEAWSEPLVVREPDDLPKNLASAFPVPAGLATSRSQKLMLGSAGSAILSVGLLGAGFYMDLHSQEYQSEIYENPSSNLEKRAEQADKLDRMWNSSNALWVSGEMVGGLAIGLGVAGFRMKF